MAEVIKMPRLSDTMEEGVIIEWHKSVGDKVEPGDVLAEVETDKATMDLESFQEGVLLHIGVEEGSVPVDAVIAVIGEEGEDYKKALEEASSQNGSDTQEEQEDQESSSDDDGGRDGARKSEEKGKDSQESQEKDKDSQESQENDTSRVKASPLARRMAEEAGLDLTKIEGSGDQGRIIKRDVEDAMEKGEPVSESAPSTSVLPSSLEDGPAYEDVAVSQMRKTIARRLRESKFSAPHFYLTIEIDMDEAVRARKQINDMIAPDKISYNDMVIKTAAIALRQHPAVNAAWMEDKIRYNKHVHIGVAVAVDDGLLVPVVNHADFKSLRDINAEVKSLAGKARNRELKLDQMQGNTFTISNLGMFGIEEFTAIINPPDSCILAVGGIMKKAVIKNDEVVMGHRMKVTMSCDHRVVDGATGAQFLQTFKNLLESPVRLIA